jgi:hypothetical protein
MTDRAQVIIRTEADRRKVAEWAKKTGTGTIVEFRKATRSAEQNAIFHAICADLAKSQMQWAGARRNMEQWKVLLVSGHTKATKGEVEIVPGIEGEFVNIRESTARMGVERATSLIEYALAFCAAHEIEIRDSGVAASHAHAPDQPVTGSSRPSPATN